MARTCTRVFSWAWRLCCVMPLGCGGSVDSTGGALDAAAKTVGDAAVTPSGSGEPTAGAAGHVNGHGGSNARAGSNATAGSGGAGAISMRWTPRPGTSWQWQLSGTLDTSFEVDVYDIDLFEISPAQLDALHAQARKVICYFDTAYEPGRPDAGTLQPYRGNPIDGWPGQYWLDTREKTVADVMIARIELAKNKGCDGLEADDVDARSNDPGFPITANNQQAFIKLLAEAAHARGLAFGLKNDLEEIPQLLASVDFAINEQCFEYDECDALTPFITAGKPVFQVEYAEGSFDTKAAEICPKANTRNFDTLIKHLELDPPRRACR